MAREPLLEPERLQRSVGALVLAAASFDQWLWRAIKQMRQGREILNYLKASADGRDVIPRERYDLLPDGTPEPREKLAKDLAAELLSARDTRQVLGGILRARRAPQEIRDIVAHWELEAHVGSAIVARTFATQEVDPKRSERARSLLRKYRPDLDQLDRDLRARLMDPGAVLISLEMIDAATQALREATFDLRRVAATAAVAYHPLMAGGEVWRERQKLKAASDQQIFDVHD